MYPNIKGFPDYHITRDGRLFNLRTGKEVKGIYHKRYVRHILHNKETNRKKNIKFHRLVAEAYIPNPDNLPVVMHLNDNPLDNRVENLKWGTQKDNVHDAISKGRLKLKGKENPMYGVHKYGFEAPHTSLNPRKIRRMKIMLGKRYTKTYIAYRLGICTSTIRNYLLNIHYKREIKED